MITASKLLDIAKRRPATIACGAYLLGLSVLPVTTVMAAVVYTGFSLGRKMGEELRRPDVVTE